MIGAHKQPSQNLQETAIELNWPFNNRGQTYPQSSPGKLEPHLSTEPKNLNHCLNLHALEGWEKPATHPSSAVSTLWALGSKFAFSYWSPKPKSSRHLLSTYCVLGTMLSPLCCPFTQEETGSVTEPWVVVSRLGTT